MQIGNLASFAVLCLALSISPGPDSLLVIKLALERRLFGFMVAAGSAIGSIAWAALVAVGAASFLAHTPMAAAALHVAGGLYLMYLGVREFLYRDTSDIELDSIALQAQSTGWRAFAQGFVSCILNPKVGLFFLLVAPQYAQPLTVYSVLSLGIVDAAVAFGWLGILAFGAAFMSKKLSDARIRQRVFRSIGLVITAVGVYVVLSAFA
ncbi:MULTISPECIES: LysE family translocator [unclassified Rhodococcus (in: high G+C Gram-positive bacteria)]|uniref:LysE family translocator n=1 Tax=unclassified Rhodococcus (in: high G+C Gram-positive bacteria) TaxID=192944 RepID=UPI00096A991F|nr:MULTISPECIES: LysE family translocator [unclassified Rhodococcus (in: high G+C Gram-positive bacteria)]